jgi:hypothetical protein
MVMESKDGRMWLMKGVVVILRDPHHALQPFLGLVTYTGLRPFVPMTKEPDLLKRPSLA